MLKIAQNKQIKDSALIASQAHCLPFRSKSFDIVVSCNAFHYLCKHEECLSDIARVLKPQGRNVITDWCDDYIACRVCDLFLRVFNRAHFKTYGRRACEHLLRNADYSNVQVERYKINWLWGLMTARARAPFLPKNALCKSWSSNQQILFDKSLCKIILIIMDFENGKNIRIHGLYKWQRLLINIHQQSAFNALMCDSINLENHSLRSTVVCSQSPHRW